MSQRQCKRCSAITKSGAQCSRTTCKYADQCYQHTQKNKGLQVKQSKIKGGGQGLYTTKPIKKGQNIAKYGGNIVSKVAYDKTEGGYGIQINKKQILDGRSTQSGLGRYANSCRTGNVKKKECKRQNAKLVVDNRKKTARVKATKNLKAGSEVYVPYGRGFWKEST